MLRLIHKRNRERGAVAVIVGLVVGMFVLTGVAALTIDAGRVYAERRVLQNGADAVSLALAQICSKDITDADCDKTNPDLAELAGANARDDGLSAIFSICGSGPDGEKFGDCPSETELAANRAAGAALIDCPALPASLPADVNYVEVRTRTLSDSSDSSKVPGVFGGLLDGAPVGKTVQACARASWSQLGTAPNTLPVVLNQCGWEAATDGGTRFGPSNPSPPPRTSTSVSAPALPSAYLDYAIQFYTHTKKDQSATTCGDRTAGGKYYPGGFGWVETTDSTHCTVDFTRDTGTWVMTGSNGAATSTGCKNNGESLLAFVGTEVYIPIVTAVSGTNYTIDGIAAFYVAGYRNAAVQQPNDFDGYSSGLTVAPPNEGLWGWFTKPIAKVGSGGSIGTTRGPIVINVAG